MDNYKFIDLVFIFVIWFLPIMTLGLWIYIGIQLYKSCVKKVNGRKFKLIKLYPDSPELNTIVFEKLNGSFNNNIKSFKEDFLIKWSEYWEEIK